jgi:cytochrome c biogenesis protein CcmG, thiol:disulfide interchange protein DsbE
VNSFPQINNFPPLAKLNFGSLQNGEDGIPISSMKKLALVFALLGVVFASNSLRGAEEKRERLKVGDVTYTNVVVTSKTATDIFILHSGGVANLKLKNLSPELQKQFGFDPEKAAELEKRQAEAKAEPRETAKITPEIPETPQAETPSSAPAATQKQIWAKSFLNQPAPEIMVEKWLSAKPETEGKFVLVDFWATWCGPCRKAIPELNNLHQKFGKKLIVIGLSDEPEEKVRAMTNPSIEYFSAIDTAKRTLRAVDVHGIPHVLLIDPSGIVRWEGYPLLEGNELTEQVVEEILTKFGK